MSETAAPWSLLPTVYDEVIAAARKVVRAARRHAAGSCATSRTATTPARACTSRSRSSPPASREPLDEYDVVKSAIQQAFIDAGATLSHHHAVGTEHARWLEQDISAAGVAMVRALLEGVDPGANLNPGKIVGEPARARAPR